MDVEGFGGGGTVVDADQQGGSPDVGRTRGLHRNDCTGAACGAISGDDIHWGGDAEQAGDEGFKQRRGHQGFGCAASLGRCPPHAAGAGVRR